MMKIKEDAILKVVWCVRIEETNERHYFDSLTDAMQYAKEMAKCGFICKVSDNYMG